FDIKHNDICLMLALKILGRSFLEGRSYYLLLYLYFHLSCSRPVGQITTMPAVMETAIQMMVTKASWNSFRKRASSKLDSRMKNRMVMKMMKVNRQGRPLIRPRLSLKNLASIQ